MPVKKIAFVHTVASLAEMFKRDAALKLPHLQQFHVLNESLLQDLLQGCDKAIVYRRVVAQILLAVDAGADMVVATCSSTSPAVDIARALTHVPIIKIDDPMATEAVAKGNKIGLICTARSTVEPSSGLLHARAVAQGRQISIANCLVEEAYKALFAGDKAEHDRLVTLAATQLSNDVEVLVLAQASLAHLKPVLEKQTRCVVLSSPDLLIAKISALTEE